MIKENDEDMTSVLVRMTYGEYKKIKVKAAELGMSMTAYIKKKALE